MKNVINVNNRCSVTLTKTGAKWLNSFNANYISEYRRMIVLVCASNEEIEKAFPTNYKEGDVLNCLTWELMRYFGGYFLTETSAPFVNNEIIFCNMTGQDLKDK